LRRQVISFLNIHPLSPDFIDGMQFPEFCFACSGNDVLYSSCRFIESFLLYGKENQWISGCCRFEPML